ncbi:MAG TPA: hypothetical protein PLU50_02835, partial [Pseudobdellovibrionaceae bacterium]|nr:hypothetical protein [Pseudobdellovibrionaceae bacterium]
LSLSDELTSACLFLSGKSNEASHFIRERTIAHPNDPDLKAFSLRLMLARAEYEQVVPAIDSERKFEDYYIPIKMKACIEIKDLNCLQNVLALASPIQKISTNGLLAAAMVAAETGRHDESFSYIEKGLQQSPYYMPLIKLRSTLEKSR